MLNDHFNLIGVLIDRRDARSPHLDCSFELNVLFTDSLHNGRKKFSAQQGPSGEPWNGFLSDLPMYTGRDQRPKPRRLANNATQSEATRETMSERIVLRTGEALVEGSEDYLCAEPEVVIGELDGPVGHGPGQPDRRPGEGAHPGLRDSLTSDVQVRPATVMVSKVTVKSGKYTNILMGTVQAAIAHGVLDAVRSGDHPQGQGQRPGDHLSRCGWTRR